MNYRLIGVLCVILLGLGGYVATRIQVRPQPMPTPSTLSTPLASPTLSPKAEWKTLQSKDITGLPAQLKSTAQVPASWQGEVVAASEALNLYDPSALGDTNLEKSQIFIRYFSANQFLTLSTVTIIERKDLTINNRAAVRYVIEKKPGVANFPNQPSWRNVRHVVTDIRVSPNNPSVFFVIAKRPDVSDEVYEKFLQSINLAPEDTSLIPPVAEFNKRITKKPFGIFITPANSPVQPEKFTGYHTGVDVEYDDVSTDTPVKSIADGEVVYSQTAAGYGGVLVLRHTIAGQSRLVLYGHLDPKTMATKGTKPKAGDIIGLLGDHKTTETDGERKHLHFAILAKDQIDIRGYVANKADLNSWHNPLDYLK